MIKHQEEALKAVMDGYMPQTVKDILYKLSPNELQDLLRSCRILMELCKEAFADRSVWLKSGR